MNKVEGLTIEQQLLIPIDVLTRQLQQMATQQEWDGDFEGCDITLQHLKTVQDYHMETGCMFYPLF